MPTAWDASMDRDRIRHFASLKYADPRRFLVELSDLEPRIAKSDLPRKVRTLRTNELKRIRELREVALFCHFIGERFETEVRMSDAEAADYDAIATCVLDGMRRYVPIQIKEVVPAYLNEKADLAATIAALSKYVASPDLTVAIHLNKNVRFEPDSMTIPMLPLKALWVFGSISPDRSRWRLWGDLLDRPRISDHGYPTPAPADRP